MDHFALYKARKAAKMTQAQLAEELDVNRATVSKYETGIITPPLNQIMKISEILNIPIIDLIGMSPEGDKENDRKLLIRLLEDYAKEHGEVNSSILSKVYYFDENGLRFKEEGDLLERLIEKFDQLNEEGQQKAIERIEELAEIPRYKRGLEE